MSRTSSLMTVFLVNMPVSLIVITLLLRHLPPAAERLRGPGRSQLADAALLAGACGALLAGLTLATGHGMRWMKLAFHKTQVKKLLDALVQAKTGRAAPASLDSELLETKEKGKELW